MRSIETTRSVIKTKYQQLGVEWHDNKYRELGDILANFFPTAFGIFSSMIESIQPAGYARTRTLER